MVRHYKWKTQRQSWNEDNMKKALEAAAAGMGKKTAARQLGVPVIALKRRAFGKNINGLPESTSVARAMGFNKPVVTKCFTLLKDEYNKYNYEPHRIINIDETSLSNVPGKNSKVIAQMGKRQVSRITSADRGNSASATTADARVLLLLDGHPTPHIAINYKPLDVGVMYPLSHHYDKGLEKWLTNHPGRVITDYQVSTILYKAYLMICSPKNAIKGFQNTGIHQYNPDIFSEEDFAPAKTTDENSENGYPDDPMRIERLTHTPQSESHKLPPSSTVAWPLDKNHRAHTKTVGPQPEMSMSSVKSYTIIAQNNWSSSSSISSKKGESTMARNQRKKGANVVLTSTLYKKTLEEEINARKKEEKKSLKNKRKKEQGTSGTEVTNQPRNIKTEKEKISTEKRKRMIEVTKISLKSSEDDDYPCTFCGELYKASMDRKGWSRCYVCHKWAHDACAGIEEDDYDNFQCDFCIPVARKRLRF
ncbi:hypothetical protein PR048_017738 [Dryococelus australis]|uniref:Zinc finger PHD-type domain-containing protein n=1 Tax=Dryococelus australis TaxID=614101 RepID=A0ABQ9HAB4_9NEOP|nr:hypothetical protein PR048_017738 [Dryococelus australis]